MKNFFSCIAVIIGTVIGAGFASGREILNFFNVYEKDGLLGISISCALFGIIVVLILSTINKKKIKDYSEIISNKYLSIILQCFSLICFCVMISSIGAFVKQELNINFWIGSAIAVAICYIIFLKDFSGISKISCVLVPLIIIGIIIIGVSNYSKIDISIQSKEVSNVNYTGNWFISAVLYASYNSLILIPILINFKNYNLNSKDIWGLGATTTFILGFLMFLIYRTNSIFYPANLGVELPNMLYASLLSSSIRTFYIVVLVSSIFTTAFSCGFSFLGMRAKENYERNAFIICLVAFLSTGIGFSNMINICFPIFGYIGIFQILLILITSKNGVNNK